MFPVKYQPGKYALRMKISQAGGKASQLIMHPIVLKLNCEFIFSLAAY